MNDAELFQSLEEFGRIAVAVSGGGDSMALLLLLERWAKAGAKNREIFALTVDHALREDSRAEAEWVCRVAARLGLQHKLLTWERGGGPATSLQASAREARYSLLADACRTMGIEVLVTAHTEDDQAETILMRLGRGTGVDGLAAIRERTRIHGVVVIRPLLAVTRRELRAWLQAREAQWLEDPSNEDPQFERVRVRGALAQIEKLGISSAALAMAARRAGLASQALGAVTNRFIAERVGLRSDGALACNLQDFAELPFEIARRLISRLIFAHSGEHPRLSKAEALCEALMSGVGGGHTLAGARLCLGNRPGGGLQLWAFREVGREGLPTIELTSDGPAIWDGRFEVSWAAHCRQTGLTETERDARDCKDYGEVTIGPIGDEGWKQLRAGGKVDAGWSREAALSLPGIWRGGRLLAVPDLAGIAPLTARDIRSPQACPLVVLEDPAIAQCWRVTPVFMRRLGVP